MTHVHTESTIGWGWGRIISHLADDHDIQIPMAWGVGQAHEAHLKAHLSPTSEAEEAAMTDPQHSHGDLARWHDMTNRFTVTEHLEEAHGAKVGDIWENAYGAHAAAHARPPKVEPIGGGNSSPNPEDWQKAEAQPTPHVCQICDKPLADHGEACESAEEVPPPPLPSNIRQMLSSLTDQIEAAAVPLWALVQDNETLREKLANVITQRDAMAAELITAETERSEARQAHEESEALVHDLEEINNVLRQQVDMTQAASTNLQQQVRALTERRDEALERLGEVAGERDRALEAGLVLEAQRDDARRGQITEEAHRDVEAAARDLHEVGQERDELRVAVAQHESQSQRLQGVLAQRNRAILEGGAALRAIVSGLRDLGLYGEVPAATVADEIEAILKATPSPEPEPVSTGLDQVSTRDLLMAVIDRLEG